MVALAYERFEHVFEIAPLETGAHMGKRVFVSKIRRRHIVIIKPASKRIHGQGHAVGHTAITFAQIERHLRKRRFKHVSRNAVTNQTTNLGFDKIHERLRRAVVGIAQLEHSHRLNLRIQKIGRGVAAETGIENSALDGGFVAAHQRIEENVTCQHALEIARLAHNIGQSNARIFRRGFHPDRFIQRHARFLNPDSVRCSLAARFEHRKIVFVQKAQNSIGIEISVQHDIGIIQAIMTRMGVQIALVGQLGDGPRMPSRFESVARIREKSPVHRVVEHTVRIGQRTFHLIENDAVVAQALT